MREIEKIDCDFNTAVCYMHKLNGLLVDAIVISPLTKEHNAAGSDSFAKNLWNRDQLLQFYIYINCLLRNP